MIYNYLGIFIMGMPLFRNVIFVSEHLLHIIVNCVHYKLSKLNYSINSEYSHISILFWNRYWKKYKSKC